MLALNDGALWNLSLNSARSIQGPRQEPGAGAAVRPKQQDRLVAGTVAQKIAAFDEMPDQDRIVAAARLACIDDDISAMPMRYLTLVGDMGDVFSGGQKQRILLARALYRLPRILFLDEAISHLDSRTEKLIAAALKKLPISAGSTAQGRTA